jgi:transposase
LCDWPEHVHEYLNRAAAGVVWPLGEEWDEQRSEQALFGERQLVKRLPEQVLPDFPALHSQLQQHRHLTLQPAWEEYRQIQPEGYGYSRFCELYRKTARSSRKPPGTDGSSSSTLESRRAQGSKRYGLVLELGW